MKIWPFLLSLLLLSFNVGAQISIDLFASGFDQPLNIQNAGDERLFIVEKTGNIKILNADGTVNATPFLDLSGIINTDSERGLLGLAFHPDYTTNGYFYVDYSDLNGDNQISRFSVDAGNPNIADETSELPLLTIQQPFANHNGGCILFGPDGYLYIASGDGGSGGDPGNRAQNTELLLGKLLRIDVDNPGGGNNYGIPPDNPFANDPPNAEEIWAYGLRNPWKFSFDSVTNDLWIADVGQNAFEEINKVTPTEAGLNYGWRCYEASAPFNTANCPDPSELTFPVAEYSHATGNSITGGYVYRGSMYTDILGLYFFADFGSSIIGAVDSNNNLINYGSFGGGWSSFGEDAQGELYLSSFGGNIYKLKGEVIASTQDLNNNTFKIYPNPSNEIITIQSETELINDISIFDINGRLIYSENIIPSGSIIMDVSKFSKGIYLLEITSEKGTTTVKKLIVK